MAEAEQAEIERLRADNQRLRAEARDSAAANAKFRVLFEHSSDAHLIFDDTGIIDCNRAAVEMLRCADKTQVLRLHPAVLSPEVQPDGRRSLEKSVEMDGLARSRGYHRFEWTHRRMTGEDFPVEVTLTPVELPTGPALLVVWHELTEIKRREQELQAIFDADWQRLTPDRDPAQRAPFQRPGQREEQAEQRRHEPECMEQHPQEH